MGNSISLTKIVCLYLHGNGAQFLSPDESMVGAGMVRETLKHMYVLFIVYAELGSRQTCDSCCNNLTSLPGKLKIQIC